MIVAGGYDRGAYEPFLGWRYLTGQGHDDDGAHSRAIETIKIMIIRQATVPEEKTNTYSLSFDTILA